MNSLLDFWITREVDFTASFCKIQNEKKKMPVFLIPPDDRSPLLFQSTLARSEQEGFFWKKMHSFLRILPQKLNLRFLLGSIWNLFGGTLKKFMAICPCALSRRPAANCFWQKCSLAEGLRYTKWNVICIVSPPPNETSSQKKICNSSMTAGAPAPCRAVVLWEVVGYM